MESVKGTVTIQVSDYERLQAKIQELREDQATIQKEIEKIANSDKPLIILRENRYDGRVAIVSKNLENIPEYKSLLIEEKVKVKEIEISKLLQRQEEFKKEINKLKSRGFWSRLFNIK